MGLVKLVLESVTKRDVQRLTQTYLTLSLQDIAQAVDLPTPAAAELVILRCTINTLPLTHAHELTRAQAGIKPLVRGLLSSAVQG